MKKLILLLFALLIFAVSISTAQIGTSGLSQAESLSKPVYGLGFSASWASGIGISFRSHLPSKSSVQGVFGIIKTSDRLYMSIGGEYQFDLVRSNTTRFYVGSALSYFYNGDSKNDVSGPFRVGAGVGGEFHIRNAFHISAGGMFVFFSDGRVIPLPQISAHYYFF